MSENFYQQTTTAPPTPFDVSLRPPAFSEFIGQEKVKDRILLMLEAAKGRGDVLDHVLLSGPPGLGKTTLANLIARAAGTQLHTTSGPQIEKAGDLAGILTNIQKGDILFIDEIHRLHPAIEEYLYPAMEDFRLDIIIDSGPSARSIQINLPKFTLVGATTRSGMLTAPLRSRFGLANRLDYYTHDELALIIERSAGLLEVPIERDGALEVASRSRGTPRVANALLRWVRDFAQVRGWLAGLCGHRWSKGSTKSRRVGPADFGCAWRTRLERTDRLLRAPGIGAACCRRDRSGFNCCRRGRLVRWADRKDQGVSHRWHRRRTREGRTLSKGIRIRRRH